MSCLEVLPVELPYTEVFHQVGSIMKVMHT